MKTCFRVLAVVLPLVLSAPARAQPSAPVVGDGETSAMTDKARELYLDGQKAAAKGRWGEAHAAWLAAWGLKRQYQIASNLGTAEAKLGRYRDAAEHLAYYIREAPERKAKERQTALSLLAEVRTHVGALTLRVEPAGADVMVDGVVVGKAPLREEVFVEPGVRRIQASFAGYEVASVLVEVAVGASREVPLTLVKSGAGPVNMGGSATSAGGSALDAGGARVNAGAGGGLDRPGAGGASGGVVKEGGAVGREGDGAGTATESGGPRRALIITGIAASSVAIVGGVVFAALSTAHDSDAEAFQKTLIDRGDPSACSPPTAATECDGLSKSLAAKGTFGNASVWSFVVGGVVGVGTVIYALSSATTKTKARGALELLPIATANGGGLLVHGRW